MAEARAGTGIEGLDACTVLLRDDRSRARGDLQLESISDGALLLDRISVPTFTGGASGR